jgi:hypothetical protein
VPAAKRVSPASALSLCLQEWLSQPGRPIVLNAIVNKPVGTETNVVHKKFRSDVPNFSKRAFALWWRSAQRCTLMTVLLKFILDGLRANGKPRTS